jgi:hypothetical protein
VSFDYAEFAGCIDLAEYAGSIDSARLKGLGELTGRADQEARDGKMGTSGNGGESSSF